MNTKTMEGLAGASTNMNLLNTPMRVFKEARRKGDIDTMERAMGYVGDFSEKAEEYQKKADEGIKEDAEEAREKEKLAREKAIEKRREEKRNSQEKMEESKAAKAMFQFPCKTCVDETVFAQMKENYKGTVTVFNMLKHSRISSKKYRRIG